MNSISRRRFLKTGFLSAASATGLLQILIV